MLLADAVITDGFRYTNYGEAALWFVVSVLAWKASVDRKHPRDGGVLMITFIAFGISDLVETTTGAWWRPWWLFVWKALCILIVIVTVGRMWLATRRPSATPCHPRSEA